MAESMDSSLLPGYLRDIIKSQNEGQSVVIIMNNEQNTLTNPHEITIRTEGSYEDVDMIPQQLSLDQDHQFSVEGVESSTITSASKDSNALIQYEAVQCESTVSQSIPTGTLDSSFVTADKVIEILTTFSYSMALHSIPNGNKSNIYYVVRYDKGFGLGDGKPNFLDDCGHWLPEKGFTSKSFYLVEANGTLKLLHKRDGLFCKMQKKDGKKNFIPIEPQPEYSSILELIRNYSTLQRNTSSKRRITWLGSQDKEKVALVEYLGICPAFLKQERTNKKPTVLGSLRQETAKMIKTTGKFVPSSIGSSIQGINDSNLPSNCQENLPNSQNFVHPLSAGRLDNGFFPADYQIKLLTSYKYNESLNSIPRGIKNNVYFMIKDDENEIKRLEGKHSSFPDDSGPWQSDKCTTSKSYYLSDQEGNLRIVCKRKGIFCAQYKSGGKIAFTPIDPQPAIGSVLEVCRYYSKLKKDLTYKRRITWLGNGVTCREKIAMVEYLGVFPGLSPHGNSSKRRSIPTKIEQAIEAVTQAMLDTHPKGSDITGSKETDNVDDDETSKDKSPTQSTQHPEAEGCLSNSFLESNEIFNILTKSEYENGLVSIPNGTKNNVYFVIKNKDNLDRRNLGNMSRFPDDSGPWNSDKGTTSISYFLIELDGHRRHIFKKKGVFCVSHRENKKQIFVAMDPQPPDSRIVALIRYYSTSKKDNSYKRRITYFGGGAEYGEKVAVVEYLGIYPGKAEHGNTNKKRTYVQERIPTKVPVWCRKHGKMSCQECTDETKKKMAQAANWSINKMDNETNKVQKKVLHSRTKVLKRAVKSVKKMKDNKPEQSLMSSIVSAGNGNADQTKSMTCSQVCPVEGLVPVQHLTGSNDCPVEGLVPVQHLTGSNVCPVEGLVPVNQVLGSKTDSKICSGKKSDKNGMETENDSSSEIVDLEEKYQGQVEISNDNSIQTGKKLSEKEYYNLRKSKYSPAMKSWREISSRKRKFQDEASKRHKGSDTSVNNDLFNVWKTHDYCQPTNKKFSKGIDGSGETLEVVSLPKSNQEVKGRYGENLQTKFLENIQDSIDRLTENIETKGYTNNKQLPEFSNGVLQHAVNYIGYLQKEMSTLEKRISNLQDTNSQLTKSLQKMQEDNKKS